MRLAELSPVGERVRLDTLHFSAEDIVRFATKFDPQPFHLDADAARDSVFGALCASGWHTSAGWMKTFLSHWAKEVKRLKQQGIEPPKLGPSPGFRKLQWKKPVYAGDDITYFVTLLDTRPLASRPGLLLNTTFNEGVNQAGETVISFESNVLEFE
ncbi:MaoC family dehydratase [Agrobacterium tumefaciens]|uniref:MaoC family dehydratase n=1 Tax=Agrobacterium tumefaciens TaxID=358 RepID=UPI00287E3590|nr:MaoC family dehydratase [Agrobacterium tumefaciens]MDS7597652.1 MaoC family dehydratase [Agrobacterium tumefaciens]